VGADKEGDGNVNGYVDVNADVDDGALMMMMTKIIM
jgi:hypothetical protein